MRRFFWIRLSIFLRQSRWGFALLAAWFALGTIVFHYSEHLPLREAFLNAIYLRVQPGSLWTLYSFWGQCVLFGIVISIFILQALQRYNPQEGCRMLASEMKDHIIVVGHSHLGARLVAHLRQTAHAYVLIDKDPAAVDDLVRAGEPVIVDDAKQESTLVDAGIERANATRTPPSSYGATWTNSPKSSKPSAPAKSFPAPRVPSTKSPRTSAVSAPPVEKSTLTMAS